MIWGRRTRKKKKKEEERNRKKKKQKAKTNNNNKNSNYNNSSTNNNNMRSETGGEGVPQGKFEPGRRRGGSEPKTEAPSPCESVSFRETRRMKRASKRA